MVFAAPAVATEANPTAMPLMPAFEEEPNGTPAGSTPIVSGERIRGSISPGGDVDFYQFSASAGDQVFAATPMNTLNNLGETQLSLIASDGASVIEADYGDGTFRSSSLAGVTIPTSGTYYMKVNAPSLGAEVVLYDLYLQVRSGSPVPESEPNSITETANSIASGYVSGGETPEDRHDVYAMQLHAGDSVFLSLDLDPERDGEGFNGRLGFGPVGESGSFFAVQNNSPSGTPSDAYEITVLKGGTYYALVTAAKGEGGPEATYRLSATVLPAEEPSCRTYTSSPSPGGIPDQGEAAFPISVPDAGTISRAAVGVDLTHSRMQDLAISLRTPDDERSSLWYRGATPEAHMVERFDPYAADASTYLVNPVLVQPHENFLNIGENVDWLNGHQTQGTWDLVVRDEEASETGSVSHIELIFCTAPEAPEPVPAGSQPPPKANPSNQFTIGKLRKGRLKVILASAGAVRVVAVRSRFRRKRKSKGRPVRAIKPSTASGGPGAIWVPLRLTRKARLRLKRRRVLRFKATVSFTPTGGSRSTKTTVLKLHGRSRKR
jgi:subtilisin-like proprotein convertase family protein